MPKIRPFQTKGYVSTPYKQTSEFTIFEDESESIPENKLAKQTSLKEMILIENANKLDSLNSDLRSKFDKLNNYGKINSELNTEEILSTRLPLSNMSNSKDNAKSFNSLNQKLQIPQKNTSFKSNDYTEEKKIQIVKSLTSQDENTNKDNLRFIENSITNEIKWESWMNELEPEIPWRHKELLDIPTIYCEETNSYETITGVVHAPQQLREIPIDERRHQIIKKNKKKFIPMKMIL